VSSGVPQMMLLGTLLNRPRRITIYSNGVLLLILQVLFPTNFMTRVTIEGQNYWIVPLLAFGLFAVELPDFGGIFLFTSGLLQ
jgi:hypothetical protein